MFKTSSAAVCWLHPVHNIDSQGRPTPWMSGSLLQQASREHKREALENVVCRAAMGHAISTERPKAVWGRRSKTWSLNKPRNHPEISLSRSHLSIVVPDISGETETHIPLLMSDVVYAQVCSDNIHRRNIGGPMAASFVIAIGTRSKPPLPDEQSEGSESLHSFLVELPLGTVWLLCIGNCNLVELQASLFELGSFGTIRWDGQDIYQVVPLSLGEGGAGSVWLGEVKIKVESEIGGFAKPASEIMSKIAVKTLHKSHSSLETLHRETKFMAMACDHPNIIKFFGVFCSFEESHDVHHSDLSAYLGRMGRRRHVRCPIPRIIMELCPDCDLHDLLDQSGAIPMAAAVELITGVCSAVAYLHSLLVVHRDLKPENILLSGKRPILADFGIASHLHDAENMNRRVGSVGYCAPEVAIGQPYDEKVDIFSLGVIFYVLLTNSMPFAGESVEEIIASTMMCIVPLEHAVFERAPAATLTLVRALLAKKPHERPSAENAFHTFQALAPAENHFTLNATCSIPASNEGVATGNGAATSSHSSDVAREEEYQQQPPQQQQQPPVQTSDSAQSAGQEQLLASSVADGVRSAARRLIGNFASRLRQATGASRQPSAKVDTAPERSPTSSVPTPPAGARPSKSRPRPGMRNDAL
eukprot:TRINITY_DN3874_c0_g1_i2.p1 TRINITY_DN3874_c0_g1~~TRINITY_DN3874_c0_g1_i2.p1  ORF type:complete len:644 (-),score=99.34 TRINITY_DN3874_c0_g1_i2:295-2226(-)